jgi:hypothetical protein
VTKLSCRLGCAIELSQRLKQPPIGAIGDRQATGLRQIPRRNGRRCHAAALSQRPAAIPEYDRWMPCHIRPERTAPRKRSMFAWRRRRIPRVMQYPRHEYVAPAAKRFNACRANTDDETKLIPPPYFFRRWGGPPDYSPPWAVPPAWPHAAGPFSGRGARAFSSEACPRT